jgi:hypothetical protein
MHVIQKVEALVEGQNFLVIYTDEIDFPEGVNYGLPKNKEELEKARKLSKSYND